MEIDRGRGRPDNNEPRDQRDASPKSPIDLVEYRRRKEEQEENFLSPEDKEFWDGYREYRNDEYKKFQESGYGDEALERMREAIRETPIELDILQKEDEDGDKVQKSAKIIYLHNSPRLNE